jgi:hypothetical protein
MLSQLPQLWCARSQLRRLLRVSVSGRGTRCLKLMVWSYKTDERSFSVGCRSLYFVTAVQLFTVK